jgi:hypothetical protein
MACRLNLTGGQEAECKQAIPLLEKRTGISRFGGQGLRHKRVESVVGNPEN